MTQPSTEGTPSDPEGAKPRRRFRKLKITFLLLFLIIVAGIAADTVDPDRFKREPPPL